MELEKIQFDVIPSNSRRAAKFTPRHSNAARIATPHKVNAAGRRAPRAIPRTLPSLYEKKVTIRSASPHRTLLRAMASVVMSAIRLLKKSPSFARKVKSREEPETGKDFLVLEITNYKTTPPRSYSPLK